VVNKKVLKIAQGELNDNALWFMRQAGRYLPDYVAIKKGRPFSDLLKDPKAISEMSALPFKFYNPDAIVIFTDILLPYARMGYQVSYENGISVNKTESELFDYYSVLREGLRSISTDFADKTIIGVVGGPFTTLSYLYDTGRDGYARTKEKISGGETEVLKELTEEIIEFANIQARSGVDVIQIFESWLGYVSENFYENHLEKIEGYFVEKIRDSGKPVIFFSEGSSHLYRHLINLKPEVISLDWRTELVELKKMCNDCIVQGNLDPYLLNSGDDYLRKETKRIMDQGKKFRGHIFNLGHGVPQWVDYRKLALIEREVHNYDR
jgi:uroporphyrinogen decarboxylase